LCSDSFEDGVRDAKGNEVSMVLCDECSKSRKQRISWQFCVPKSTASLIADALDRVEDVLDNRRFLCSYQNQTIGTEGYA
jgi:hypothetical protein